MPCFTDDHGRRWRLFVTVASADRVFEATGIRIRDAIHRPEILKHLATDPITFVGVLFAMVKPEADRLGVTIADFLDGFTGETLYPAAQAFIDALVRSYPESNRPAIAAMLDRATEMVASP